MLSCLLLLELKLKVLSISDNDNLNSETSKSDSVVLKSLSILDFFQLVMVTSLSYCDFFLLCVVLYVADLPQTRDFCFLLVQVGYLPQFRDILLS